MQQDFELIHPVGIRIARGLTHAALLASASGHDLPHDDMGTGWVWVRLPAFQDGDVLVAASLGFHRGTLEQISLSDASSKFGSSWNDWSEEQEQLRAASIGGWLKNRGYPPGQYSWGSVWAGYDQKGAFGSAGVRYAPWRPISAGRG